MTLTKKLFFICLISFSLTTFTSCQRNAEGRKVIAFASDSSLNQQSATAYSDLKKKSKISKNAKWTKINKRVGQRVIAAAKALYPNESAGFKWEVTLFDEPKTVNAFCMPGGKIGIYTGILKVCKNEAALAAVMGHEVAHALLKHSNERVSHSTISSGLLAIGGFAMEQSEMKDSTKKIAMAVGGVGLQYGFMLPYSRTHETESDNMGLKLMAKAGYEPKEAANLWRRMKATSNSKMPGFLSTHPSHDNRINNLEEKSQQVKELYKNSPKYGLGETL
jgi:predicted Zn-dependent protease